MADTEIRNFFKVIYEQSGLRQVIQGQNRLSNELKNGERSLSGTAKNAAEVESLLGRINKSAGNLPDTLKQSTEESARFFGELQGIVGLSERIRDASESIGFNRGDGLPEAPDGVNDRRKFGSEGLQQVGSSIFNLPSTPIAGGLTTDVLGRIIRLFGQLGFTLTTLSATVAAIITPLAILFKSLEDVRKQVKRNSIEYGSFIDTLSEGFSNTDDITSESLRRREENAQRNIDFNNLVIQELGNTEQELQNTVRAFSAQQLVALTSLLTAGNFGSAGFVDDRGFSLRPVDRTLDRSPDELLGVSVVRNPAVDVANILRAVFGDELIGNLNDTREGVSTLQDSNSSLQGVLTGVNNEVLRQIATQNDLRNRQQSYIDQLIEINQIISQTDFGIDEFSDLQTSLEGQRDSLREQIRLYARVGASTNELETQLQGTEQQLNILNRTGERAAIINQQRIDAELALNAAREESLRRINRDVDDFVDFSNIISDGTIETARDRVDSLLLRRDAIRSEINNLQGLAATGDEGAISTLERYDQEITDINNTLTFFLNRGLAATASNSASALSRQAADVNRVYLESVDVLESSLGEKLASIVRSINDQIETAALRRDRALEDLDDKRLRDETKAARDKNDKLADLEQDLADKRAAIIRNFNRDSANAIANRDALALFLARQRRDDELRQLSVEEERKRREIADAYDRQLRTIRDKLAEQREEILESYEQRVADIRRDAERRKAEAQRDFQIQLQELKAQRDAELAVIRTNKQNVVNEFQSMMTEIANTVAAGAANTVRRLATSIIQAGNLPNNPPNAPSPPRPPRVNRVPAELSPDVLNPVSPVSPVGFISRGMVNNNVAVQINNEGMGIQGADRVSIRREVDRQLNNAFDEINRRMR